MNKILNQVINWGFKSTDSSLTYVTGLQVPQAVFSLQHPVLLHKDP
jgi:hypothetical protein